MHLYETCLLAYIEGGYWKDNCKERKREGGEGEGELGNHDGQFMMRRDSSQTCRWSLHVLFSPLNKANATICVHMFAQNHRLKGTTGGEPRKKTARQFDGTHEATMNISLARHRGNLALYRGEVTAIPAKFVVFVEALSSA